DPALTVRLPDYRGRQPLRVVVTSSGDLRPARALFDAKARTVVATASHGETGASPEHDVDSLSYEPGPNVPLRRLLRDLAAEPFRCTSVLIEGGPSVAWSAIEERVVDR